MSPAPNLLNENGTASMATMLMLSHHAFRRDIMRFIRAIDEIKAGDASRADKVRSEWEKSYRAALHGHHTAEDKGIFPDLRSKYPELADALDKLTEQHHHIDPVIEKIDAALVDIAHPENAEAAFNELKTLLDEHLAFEEANITPFLRGAGDFPPPADETAAAMYAQGFAWSMQGIAPEVLEQVEKMLPNILREKVPAARAEFEERSQRVWGTFESGSATTPIPTAY